MMNMASYSNGILELLSEVGKFLKETLENEILSVAAQKHRARLLHQLELLLRNASPASPETPPPYLDMNGGKGKMTAAKEEYVGADTDGLKVDEVYYYEEFPSAPASCVSSPSSRQASPSSSSNAEDAVVLALPYRELQLISPKRGPLLRKDKFIFLENWRRSWAGIHMRTLLLYNGERDVKPCFCIDLKDYEARRVSNNNQKDVKKKEALFEIVCPGKKTYQFVARTAKDMEQWIAAICNSNSAPGTPVSRRTSQDSPRRLPSLPADSEAESEEYDDIGVNKTTECLENYEQIEHHEEEFYQDIADFQPQHDEAHELPPELPPRVPVGEECYEDIPEDNSKPKNMTTRSKILKPAKIPLPPKLWTEQNPTTPQEEEELYDDVATINPNNVYYNMLDRNLNDSEQKETTIPKDNNISEIEEEIYDDIGVKETLPDSPFKTAIHSNGSGGRIHHLIQRMEATLTVGGTTVASLRPNPPSINNQVVSSVGKEELYEPIDDPGNDTFDNETPLHIPPQLPPRGNAIRS